MSLAARNKEKARELLGVSEDCTPAALRKVFAAKMMECHPDQNGGVCTPEMNERLQAVKQAYDILNGVRRSFKPGDVMPQLESVFNEARYARSETPERVRMLNTRVLLPEHVFELTDYLLKEASFRSQRARAYDAFVKVLEKRPDLGVHMVEAVLHECRSGHPPVLFPALAVRCPAAFTDAALRRLRYTMGYDTTDKERCVAAMNILHVLRAA